jgi:hypothetical protein
MDRRGWVLGTTVAVMIAGCACGDGTTPPPDAETADVPVAIDATEPGADVPAIDAPVVDDGGTPLVTYTEDREPCADRRPTRRALFGDLHVHTSYSFDAYAFEVRNDPAAAYRFARGEAVPLADVGTGPRTAQLRVPLDFAGVTDHSEFLGEIELCTTVGSPSYDSLGCRTYRSGTAAGFAFLAADLTMAAPERQRTVCGVGDTRCTDAATEVWGREIDAAEDAYDRTSTCEFTSFVAYEWTGSTGRNTLHRNVFFRNANVPALPVTYYEAPTPTELWAGLRTACLDAGTGCDVLAIPHNSNLSSGFTFDVDYPGATTEAEERAAALARVAMEPLVEIAQHKGASECSTIFSTDEDCGFEMAGPDTLCNGDGSGTGTNCTARSGFVRYGLLTGIEEEVRIGANPFHLGFVGATDTHNGTPGNTEEDTFGGHVGAQDGDPATRLGAGLVEFSPGALTGVWAVENSRDAIFEAFRRRETFATSGTRIELRFFAGAYAAGICADPDMLEIAYADGVPMGASLDATPAGPTFVVAAAMDRTPIEALQIVKLYLDEAGEPQEDVFDVLRATPAPTVDPATCATSGAGLAMPCATWTDPDYEPTRHAVYYARVLEAPTCRWSTRDCNALPVAERPPACTDGSVETTIHERAWSSPIWLIPTP